MATADRVSSLPDEILASIISRLPLEESARTSILSSRWRHLWALAPLDLHLDDDGDCEDLKYYDEDLHYLLSRLKLIADVFSCHRGPIRSFRLSRLLWRHLLESWHFDQALDSWAQTLAQRGIQNLDFRYKLPPQLLACQSLHSLDLLDCNHPEQIRALPQNLKKLKLWPRGATYASYPTELPPAIIRCRSLCSLELRFYDLKEPLDRMRLPPSLRELTLSKVQFAENVLSHVFSECRSLDALCLDGCYIPSDVCISSSSLRRFTARTLFLNHLVHTNFVIEDAPNLETFMLDSALYKNDNANMKVVNAPKLQVLGFFCSDSSILEFGGTCFQDGTITKFGTCLYSIKKLEIALRLREDCQPEVVLDLLKCFPCLENLDLLMVYFPGRGDYQRKQETSSGGLHFEQETSSDCLDHHLKKVRLRGYSLHPSSLGHAVIALARYLVCNARLLKVISLCYFEGEESWEEIIKGELLLENKASSDLVVVFDEMNVA